MGQALMSPLRNVGKWFLYALLAAIFFIVFWGLLFFTFCTLSDHVIQPILHPKAISENKMESTSRSVHILTQKEAREIARKTYKQLAEIENDFTQALELQDLEGVKTYVTEPVRTIIRSWPDENQVENKTISKYGYCKASLFGLDNMASEFLHRPPGLERVRNLKADFIIYQDSKKYCKMQIDGKI